jgi:hypothetical protein
MGLGRDAEELSTIRLESKSSDLAQHFSKKGLRWESSGAQSLSYKPFAFGGFLEFTLDVLLLSKKPRS